MGFTQDIIDYVGELLHGAVTSFDTMTQNASDVLTSGISESLWTDVVNLSDNLVPFCNIIVGLCMMLELAKIASKVDLIKWEHGLKVGVKMVLAKVCIEIAPTFLHACYNQACLFISSMSSAGTALSLSGTVDREIETYIDGVSGMGSALGLLVSTLLIQMAIKICGLLVLVIAYGRMFEILVYLLVSPIPVAFACYNEGNDGISRITMRFIKSFIAVCLQGLMMYMCIRLFGMVVGSAFTDLVELSEASTMSSAAILQDLCYDMLLFCIILVMAVAKCGSWAKSIMDAG
jgi:hypothetical protein